MVKDRDRESRRWDHAGSETVRWETVRVRDWDQDAGGETVKSRRWERESERPKGKVRKGEATWGLRSKEGRLKMKNIGFRLGKKEQKWCSFGISGTGPKPVQLLRFVVFTVKPAISGFWPLFPNFRFFQRTKPDRALVRGWTGWSGSVFKTMVFIAKNEFFPLWWLT
jgi:hypothetical protein